MSSVHASALPIGVVAARCEHCRHRQESRRVVERSVAGLVSFGSAYGASIGDSRLCGVHDCWVSPGDSCERFSSQE